MSTSPAVDLDALVATAQRNCDLADARHAQGMSLCAYLLDLREYYRWQHGLALDAVLERPLLSAWISRREAHWEDLRAAPDHDFQPLLAADSDDPFDEAAFNAALAAHGLVCGAGIGRFGRPLFFLAERRWVECREGIEILVAGRELARGLTAPPAVSRDGRVLIRLDALERWLWTKYEEWQHHPHDSGFAVAYAMYADGAADPLAGVRAMALGEVETLVLHEIGEQRADGEFGDDWDEMLSEAASRKAELFVRALRDLFADCAYTLPTLIGRDAEASIHFWFGTLEGVRRQLAAGLIDAYRAWGRGDRAGLEAAAAAAAGHWQDACRNVLGRWRESGWPALEALAQAPEPLFFTAPVK